MLRMPTLPVPALLVVLSALAPHVFPWSENPSPESMSSRTGETLAADARAVLGVYCSSCHNQGRAKIDLDGSVDVTPLRDRPMWEKVIKAVRAGKMPPSGGRWPMPSQEERDSLITWIEGEFLKETPESDRLARWRSRRLLRTEYLNTIRDLFGISFQPGSDFPKDDPAWKRTKDVPTLSPLLMARYQAAAEQILQEFFPPKTPLLLFPPGDDDDEDVDQTCELPNSFKEERARDVIAQFAYRAFRRPLAKDELKRLTAVYLRADKEGLGHEDSLRAVLKWVLTAPQFLFRIESVGGPNPPSRNRQFELASRLSFFLWSSAPDEELLAQAEQGSLGQNLHEQARRMLRDSKSRNLAINFADSWFELDKLPIAGNKMLRAAQQETQHFVAAIIREDRSVLEFLDADYTFLNEILAQHYGIPGIKGAALRRVALSGKQRGGLITQASILMLNSLGGDASPVKRGKWILENLLDSPPLAPPSGLLQALDESRKVFKPGTVRQLMEQHRASPSCAACHAQMDAFGIALENFDGNGAWRTTVDGRPVDATGLLPDGQSVTGPDQLKAYLLGKQDLFVRGLSRKLLTYAIGRKLEKSEAAALDAIPPRVAQNQHRFSSVLLEVVQSGPFQEVLRIE